MESTLSDQVGVVKLDVIAPMRYHHLMKKIIIALINLTLSLIGFYISYVIVFKERIGPVVLVIDERRGMGVHIGDLLAAAPFSLAMISLFFCVRCLQGFDI